VVGWGGTMHDTFKEARTYMAIIPSQSNRAVHQIPTFLSAIRSLTRKQLNSSESPPQDHITRASEGMPVDVLAEHQS